MIKRVTVQGHVKLARRWALAGLIASVAMFATACGDDDAGGTSVSGSGDEPVRIAFFNHAIGNTYSAATQDAIEKVAAESGATVKVFDANGEADKQFAQMQDALTTDDYDALLTVPLNAVGLKPVLRQAEEQDIPVGTISYPAGDDLTKLDPQLAGVTVNVLDLATDRGKWMGEMTVDACKGIDPCKVAYLPGYPGIPVEEVFQEYFERTIAGHPNVDVVAVQPGSLQAGPSSKVVENILQRTPDLNVVTASGDQMIQGAQIALRKSGMKAGTDEGEVRLIGLGASEAGVAGVSSGEWFGTVLSLPYDEGKIAAELIIKAARGELKQPVGVSAALESGLEPEVTKENVDAVTAQWKG